MNSSGTPVPAARSVCAFSTESDPPDGDEPRRRNPWFILSGLCMLGGCALVNLGVHGRKDEIAPVVGMVLTIAVYQALVAALAVWLARTGRSRRDAGVLTALLVVLAADTTLLMGELITATPLGGGLLAAAALSASLMELTWVLGALGVRLGPVGWAVTGVNLAVAVALPAVFRGFGPTGFLPHAAVYAGSWTVAGAMAWTAALWAAHAWHSPWRATRLHALVLALPVASQALHLLAGLVTYGIEPSPTLAAPLLLGVGAALMLLGSAWFGLPAGGVALLTALAATGDVPWMPAETGLTPWRLTLLGAAAVLVTAGLVRQTWWVAALSVLPVWAAAMGPEAHDTGQKLGGAGRDAGGLVARVLRWVVPDTAVGWGVYAAALAFVLLGIGAWRARRPDGPRGGDVDLTPPPVPVETG